MTTPFIFLSFTFISRIVSFLLSTFFKIKAIHAYDQNYYYFPTTTFSSFLSFVVKNVSLVINFLQKY